MAKQSNKKDASDLAGDVVLRPLTKSAPMALLRVREAFMRKFRPMLHRHGFTEQQWRVLRVLMESESMEVTRLAEAAVILPPSLSRILRNMEADGLIRRRPVRDDQRRALISSTSKGRKAFNQVAPDSDRIYRKIEAQLGSSTLAQLDTLLSRLESDLDAMGKVD